jgi:DNA-directed RNA polymerase subunit RPC12/RpoP
MQTFVCPQCGAESSFDPRLASARCPACGFSPPTDARRGRYLHEMGKLRYRSYLLDLLGPWDSAHPPDPAFDLVSVTDAEEFYADYRRSLGEHNPAPHPRGELLLWAAGYACLRRGEMDEAAHHFELLVSLAPDWADAWVWRAATVADAPARQSYLETALRLEPGHILASEALAILQGKTPHPDQQAVASSPDEPAAGIVPPRLIRCGGCGARLLTTVQPVLRCFFCGSPAVREEAEEAPGVEAAGGVLPFQLDEGQARAAFGAWQAASLRGLRAWWPAWTGYDLDLDSLLAHPGTVGLTLQAWWRSRACRATSIQGIYLPFWAFDGLAGEQEFRGILLPAVTNPAPSLTERLLPFDLRPAAPFQPGLLAEWSLCLPDLGAEAQAGRAGEIMRALAQRRLELASESGKPEVEAEIQAWRLVLLPAWVARLEHHSGRLLALVNGQSGEVAVGRS